MPAMKQRSAALIALAVLAAMALPATPASAEKGIGGGTAAPPPEVSGDQKDGSLTATAGGISYDTSKNGTGPKAGPIAPAGDYSPP
ncbi:hypothetical protein GKQ77_32675, partial [Streptomyces sp. BG9H]|nr:hypothetical protein [Streptomyces anatolicus]